jgi:hypothetical protein
MGFKSGFEAAGQRGSAILVGRDSLGAPEFTLQFRVVDRGQEDSIKSDNPMSLITDVRFVFCPWCGRNAEKFYSGSVDALFRPDLKIIY